jgi:hypothetical protein
LSDRRWLVAPSTAVVLVRGYGLESVKVNVYVDGFNLYYGCLKGTPYRWLNLQRLAELLLPRDEIHRIRYFTARITARPGDPDAVNRQQAYLRALATLPLVEIHFGQFLVSRTRMALVHPPAGEPRTAEVIKTEEKGSDVNLASYLLVDAFARDCEAAAIVTNDSDLAEPLALARDRFGLTTGVLQPIRKGRHPSRRLQADFYRRIRSGALANSQFPEVMHDAHGAIHRPKRWSSP